MTSWSSIKEGSKQQISRKFLLCYNKKISNYCMQRRLMQHFLWRSVCGCIFQGNVATNYR